MAKFSMRTSSSPTTISLTIVVGSITHEHLSRQSKVRKVVRECVTEIGTCAWADLCATWFCDYCDARRLFFRSTLARSPEFFHRPYPGSSGPRKAKHSNSNRWIMCNMHQDADKRASAHKSITLQYSVTFWSLVSFLSNIIFYASSALSNDVFLPIEITFHHWTYITSFDLEQEKRLD